MPWIAAAFLFAGAVIAVVGTVLTGLVDRLADRTRLGEAISGGLLLGATTSLPDIVVSASAAAAGHADLAVSNALGGIAVQTVFLVVADMAYRRANLEHAAASLTNLFSATLLIVLLATALLAATGPDLALWAIHPATPALFLVYLLVQRMAARHREEPAWIPAETGETVRDEPEARNVRASLAGLWLRFAGAALTVAAAGYVVAQSGIALTEKTGLSGSLVGVMFTGFVTSCAELVIAIAAVRRGALTLAVGGVIGGNAFDALLIPISDIAYREGSVYHAIPAQPLFLIGVTILMTAVLLLGLLRRQRRGIGNIGFEGVLVLLLYALMVAYLVFA
nr:sodium:calcium antiporter [Thioalkalivibrio sp. XN8]